MTRSLHRLVVIAFLASGLVPLVTETCSRLMAVPVPAAGDGIHQTAFPLSWRFLGISGGAFGGLLLATFGFYALLRKFESRIDNYAHEQCNFLESFSSRYVNLAIFGSAALSLFLELAVIRWQSTVFEFFAFYKNFSLLACFAGLGLGYALADRKCVPLGFSIPLLAWQFVLMISLRYGRTDMRSLFAMPFREQLNMGVPNVHSLSSASAIYFFLFVIFLLTVLAFIPIGQLCGRLMERREKLMAYGLNLLGSLAGVALILFLSSLWTPPFVWFVVGLLPILAFYLKKQSPILLGASFTAAALIALAWPVNSLWNRIYSPYQLLELGHDSQGLMIIRAAGHYYQRVHDLARSNHNVELDPKLKSIRDYYELPYRIHGNPKDVAIVGAGTGNDVAAALRSGADAVDAIEIDPAILQAGVADHPEHPYQDRRVRAIVNDARSFLRRTNKTYDMVVYGLLDSHTLLSHASSIRLDSFVYTVQGLREARARLKPGGILSLSFSVINPELGRKIYLMMQEAFDGRPPVCIAAKYDGSVIFLEANDKDIMLPASLLGRTGFIERTAFYANSEISADVSTDDWPFFYMPRRIYPVSYLVMVMLVLVLSFGITANFVNERPRFSHMTFFLLGAGFMLVETKGITELGLTFGNSWEVIGIVIAGILLMAFLANCVVQWLHVQRPYVPYALLLASLAVGWFISRSGGLASTPFGRLATAVVLTCPILFSGIVFSTLLRSHGQISGIMAVNLLGAMCGGLLEYNSMYFGFRALYLIAIILYLAGLGWEVMTVRIKKPALQVQAHAVQL